MFRGPSAISLDAKGRIALPAKYRDSIQASCQGQLILSLHFADPCLLLFPLNEWEAVENQLQQLPAGNPVSRAIQRRVLGTASEVELDSAGRLLLPAFHREQAGLDKQVMLVGQMRRFEIWNEQRWKEQLMLDQQTIQTAGLGAADFADSLKDLSLGAADFADSLKDLSF